MRPSFRQIEYFVAVADHQAFGTAAKTLAVSQPSLSKQLQTMEADLGGPLFERTSRRVTLTPLGEKLLPHARAILKDVRDFKALAQGDASIFGNRLNIGVLPSIGAYFMPVANKLLHKTYPDLRLVVREGATVQLLSFLRDGTLDCVIGTPTSDTQFENVFLFSETLYICAAADDPLSNSTGPISLADLADKPLLCVSPDFRLAEIAEHLAREAGTYVSRDYQGASLDAVRQMAVMGAGVAVLPSLYAFAEAIRDPEFVIRRIDHPDALHDIHLHWRKASPHAADFRRLAEHLIEVKMEVRAKRSERFD